MIQKKKSLHPLEVKNPVLDAYLEFYMIQIILVIVLVSVIEMRHRI